MKIWLGFETASGSSSSPKTEATVVVSPQDSFSLPHGNFGQNQRPLTNYISWSPLGFKDRKPYVWTQDDNFAHPAFLSSVATSLCPQSNPYPAET